MPLFKKSEITEHWTLTSDDIARFLGTTVGENDKLFLTAHGTSMIELSIVRTPVSTEWEVA